MSSTVFAGEFANIANSEHTPFGDETLGIWESIILDANIDINDQYPMETESGCKVEWQRIEALAFAELLRGTITR